MNALSSRRSPNSLRMLHHLVDGLTEKKARDFAGVQCDQQTIARMSSQPLDSPPDGFFNCE